MAKDIVNLDAHVTPHTTQDSYEWHVNSLTLDSEPPQHPVSDQAPPADEAQDIPFVPGDAEFASEDAGMGCKAQNVGTGDGGRSRGPAERGCDPEVPAALKGPDRPEDRSQVGIFRYEGYNPRLGHGLAAALGSTLLAACQQDFNLNDFKGKTGQISLSSDGNVLSIRSNPAGTGGDGGSNPGGSGGPSVLVAPAEDAQAVRFLLQTKFAANPQDIAAVKTKGYRAWLDEQQAIPHSIPAFDWLKEKFINPTSAYLFDAHDFTLWHQLTAAPDEHRQRIALALSEFFVVNSRNSGAWVREAAGCHYWDILCNHAFGNYRDLLEAVTLSTAMSCFLSFCNNRRADPVAGRKPDENYARELMQLFSIGLYELNLDGTLKLDINSKPIETYDQTTVAELAELLTGWVYDLANAGPDYRKNPQHDRNPLILQSWNHSKLEHRFFNIVVAANTPGQESLKILLDTLFMHPNTAPFFCKQMIQRLVTSNPSPAYVARVAQVFVNNGQGVRGDLGAVFKAIFLDFEARNEALVSNPMQGKVREPLVRFVQWARTFNTTSPDGLWTIRGDYSDPGLGLAQAAMTAPSVFNFFRPDYKPNHAAFSDNNLVAPELQITTEISVTGYANTMIRAISNTAGISANYQRELAFGDDISALIRHLNLLLTANQLSASTLNIIATGLQSILVRSDADRLTRVQGAILAIMLSPDYIVQK